MNVLLADDEVGIREGLATFLRLKGIEVRTAGRCDEALELLATHGFDAVLTDWHLEDGVAAPLLEASPVPVFVVSGYPEQVTAGPNLARVLSKPVAPAAMLEQLQACGAASRAESGGGTSARRGVPSAPPASGDPWSDLPEDARQRIELVLDWCGGRDAAIELLDDGCTVTLIATWERGHDPFAEVAPGFEQMLAWLGGDLRVLCREGCQRLEYTIRRDGAPPDELPLVAVGDDWPDGGCRIDFDGVETKPAQFLELLDRLARRPGELGPVHLCNVPPRLRLLAEASGRAAWMPMREPVAPRLPAVLTALWS